MELTGGKKEGFRTLRVAFEPDFNIPGGCDKDVENVLNGSFAELDVLVRSRVDMQVETTWYRGGAAGVPENTPIIGEVALLRDRIDVSIENEEIQFIRQYRDETGAWVTMPGGTNNSITNEQGILNLYFLFINKKYSELDLYIDGKLTYFYWKTKDSEVIITKSLRQQYK